MAQLNSVISRGGRAFGSLNPDRSNLPFQHPVLYLRSLKPVPLFRPGFYKLFSVCELITFSKWRQIVLIRPFTQVLDAFSGLKRQIRLFVLVGPLKTLLDFNHNGYLILHLIFQTKTGYTYIPYKVSNRPPPPSPFLHTSHVVLIL